MVERSGTPGSRLDPFDQHGGLVQAIEKHFQGASWQRCQPHFIRNILDAVPKSVQNALLDEIRGILHAPNKQAALLLLEQALAKCEEKVPKAMRYRRRLRTTNSIERLNEEIRRRERVIHIFPNRESVYRLVDAVLIEIDEKWISQIPGYVRLFVSGEKRKS